MYQKFQDGEDISKIPKESDPFWEPTEDVLIGSANVFLQSLSYALDFDDKITITDYKGQEEGHLKVHVAPVKKDGKPIEEDAFVDDPHELLGKPYHVMVRTGFVLYGLVILQDLNPFPNKPCFLCVCSTSLLKTLWEKEKLLITSNFSFSHSVFYSFGELCAIFIEFEIVVCKLLKFGRV